MSRIDELEQRITVLESKVDCPTPTPPTPERSCDTCKHREGMNTTLTCVSCLYADGYPNWKPWEPIDTPTSVFREGWWYKDREGNLFDSAKEIIPLYYLPATLDNLAHEVDGGNGLKVWMVEYANDFVLWSSMGANGKPDIENEWDHELPVIIREYATLAHIPIITQTQWEALRV